MRLRSIFVLAVACLGSPLRSQPAPFTLQEALTLPAPVLSTRVLGEVGSLYTEVQRPFLGGVPGAQGFAIEFATAARSAGFPGLCEADTITVYFGPAEMNLDSSSARARSLFTGKIYRIVSDTAPVDGGWNDDYGRTLATRCANSGPVLSGEDAGLRHFFSGRYNSSNDFWPAHAYFGARALSKAMNAVTSQVLSVAECREDSIGQDGRICGDPSALVRTLPMERFLGFDIARCAPGESDLCVTANFARNGNVDGRGIAVRMRTTLSEVIGPPPEFEIREVRIRAYTVVN